MLTSQEQESLRSGLVETKTDLSLRWIYRSLHQFCHICSYSNCACAIIDIFNSLLLMSLMEIKGFLQCIAANKQQWCGLVAAASCGIVAACEFFVCKLVLLLLVAATLRLFVAATLQLFVCRECVGLVVDSF